MTRVGSPPSGIVVVLLPSSQREIVRLGDVDEAGQLELGQAYM
jgi:hypothetical protein